MPSRLNLPEKPGKGREDKERFGTEPKRFFGDKIYLNRANLLNFQLTLSKACFWNRKRPF